MKIYVSSFVRFFMSSFLRIFISSYLHSFVSSFLRIFISSFLHSFVSSCLRYLVSSFIRFFVSSLSRFFIHSFLRVFVSSLSRFFIYSFLHFLITTFLCLFIYMICHKQQAFTYTKRRHEKHTMRIGRDCRTTEIVSSYGVPLGFFQTTNNTLARLLNTNCKNRASLLTFSRGLYPRPKQSNVQTGSQHTRAMPLLAPRWNNPRRRNCCGNLILVRYHYSAWNPTW
jgi:hypothetical protein